MMTIPHSLSLIHLRVLRNWQRESRMLRSSPHSTVPSEVLFDVYESRRKTKRPSLVYCGDNPAAKKLVAELIRDVGFDPVDAGPLRIARYTEPFALLVAQLAYEGKGGPELAYRFERFKK